MSYYELEKFFKTKSELAARDNQGLAKDEIHYGCYRKTLENEFERAVIKKAIKNGWIKETLISKSNDKTVHGIYMWMDIELSQRRFLPNLIQKIITFFDNYIASPIMRIIAKD